MTPARDHGGGLDAARDRWGGTPQDWLDLSTGINPHPYPIPDLHPEDWTRLPDATAQQDLVKAARAFWQIPDHLDVLAVPGASAAIARLPALFPGNTVDIPRPTYNEHAAAFEAHGWQTDASGAHMRVVVHPNNPDGRFWSQADLPKHAVIDESFCDIAPKQSLIGKMGPNHVALKSFGKFWGLAGLRLGFVISSPQMITNLRELIGPWAVSGPALRIGTAALRDPAWAEQTRQDLKRSALRLDAVMTRANARLVGGTDLFRLYDVENATRMQDRLARCHILTRIFPYSPRWIRVGLPPQTRWDQLEAAL